jgi:hypothetical protein
MKQEKFLVSTVWSGSIHWKDIPVHEYNTSDENQQRCYADCKDDALESSESSTSAPLKRQQASFINTTNIFHNDLDKIGCDFSGFDCRNQNRARWLGTLRSDDKASEEDTPPVLRHTAGEQQQQYLPFEHLVAVPPVTHMRDAKVNITHRSDTRRNCKESALSGQHHIVAYYRHSAVNTCSRCCRQFFKLPSLNPSTACVHHAGFFVCRKHPAETKLSIEGKGDGLGYYGTGAEGFEAKFWDCCGSENPLATGCVSASHVPYE